MRLYLALAALAAFLAIVGTALWYRGQAIQAKAATAVAEASLTAALEANRMHKKAFEALTAQRARDDALMLEITTGLWSINEAARETASALDKLEKTDEGVSVYLNTPVPDSVRRLYNNP